MARDDFNHGNDNENEDVDDIEDEYEDEKSNIYNHSMISGEAAAVCSATNNLIDQLPAELPLSALVAKRVRAKQQSQIQTKNLNTHTHNKLKSLYNDSSQLRKKTLFIFQSVTQQKQKIMDPSSHHPQQPSQLSTNVKRVSFS